MVKGRKHRGVVVEDLKLDSLYCGEPNRQTRWSLTFEIGKDIKGMETLTAEKDRKAFFVQHKRILKDRALSVLLTDDQLFAFATIQRNEALLSQKPSIVTLQLQGDAGSASALLKLKSAKSIRLIQVEVALFAYEPTLKALQSMRSVPLEDEILFWKDSLILRGVPFAPQLSHIVSRLRSDPKTDLKPLIQTNTSIILDRAQGASLISALTQRVSLIQGPPGTGKSFIGALLAKCIHDFTDRTILVVCYTNHALDQFLEDLLKIGIPQASMLRLGGKSTPATEMMNIRNKRPSGRISYASVDGLKAEADVFERSAQSAFSRFKGYSVGDQEVMLHLEFDYPKYWNAFKIPTSDDGMTQVGKGGKAVDECYLLRQWSEGKGPGTFKGALNVMQHNEIWMMKPDARKAQRAKWEKEILESEVELLVRPLKEYNSCQDSLKRAFAEKSVAIMKEMRIVACTTTGAAMNFESLRAAPPQVLLVEEAGEILESHVVTSLGEGSEQMILIGDHQQLRPKVSNYQLTVEKGEGYDLNMSLFERLVLKNYPHEVLVQQHRMRPEISELIRHLTYTDLVDAPKTLNRPNLPGVPDNVIFVNHAHPEKTESAIGDRNDLGSKSSKQNTFEVEMVWKMVHYLLQQGCKVEDMVVLTPYLGQLQMLKASLQREYNTILNDLDSWELVRAGVLPNVGPGAGGQARAKTMPGQLHLATIDNYQGEESDIVIISLTRSNSNNDIGFMYSPERLNVLLSRARNSMIMIGNSTTFKGSKKGGAMWSKLFDYLKEKDHFYEGFPVRCQCHPQNTELLMTTKDFEDKAPNGGCSLPCGALLNCNIHKCPSICHPRTPDHTKMQCTEIIKSTCPSGHDNSYKCSSSGAPTKCDKCDKEAKRLQQKYLKEYQEKQKREQEKEAHERRLLELEEKIEKEMQKIKDVQLEEERKKHIEQRKRDLESAAKMADNAMLGLGLPSSMQGTTPSMLGSAFFRNSGQQQQSPGSQPSSSSLSNPPPSTPPSNNPPPTGSQQPISNTPTSAPANSNNPNANTNTTTSLSARTAAAGFGSPEAEWDRRKNIEGANNAALDSVMQMIGLEEVKWKMLVILDKIELSKRQGASMKDERFNVSLLGNPGTGKTTIARLYAQFLVSQDILPGTAFKETTGSLIASQGIPEAKKMIDEVLKAGGGAIFIDEAYQLVAEHNTGGSVVLDFLLAEMENNVGKIVFMLAGYNKQMEKFFEHNPGLPSRVPHTLKFADYTDEELKKMLQSKLRKKYSGMMKLEDGEGGLYARIVIRRLGRGRGKAGFGNARALENVIMKITERQAKRISKERRSGKSTDDFLLTQEDLIGPNPSDVLPDCTALKKLKGMIGLRTIKEAVDRMVDMIEINYRRELREEEPFALTLNKVFLGSPGTGKTTVAKLYGQIMVDLGMLSNGEVIMKNPADFVGAHLGESEKNTKNILDSAMGKILVIDEAYGLYGGSSSGSGDIYKTAVIDTIVAEVQGVPGDDRCVLLLGYEKQMEEMFQNVNPGLSRRFAIEDGFRFEDFDDNELRQILDMKLREQHLKATDRAKDVAMEHLSRERNRPNFGNGGAVENLLVQTKLRYTRRIRNDPDASIEPQDFDPNFDRHLKASDNFDQLFADVVGCQLIKDKLKDYQKISRVAKDRGEDPRKLIPTNFIFKGPPGTGKTTVARKFGQVFYDMGFLSSAEVIERSATDLVGQYVGQTGPKTQQLFEKALGRVLFIDEAYRLGEGHFAQEAIDEMVGILTQDRFKSKIIVILAGYDQDMNNLLAVNSGLSSRFPEEIFFNNFDVLTCLDILQQQLDKDGTQLNDLRDSTSSGYKDMTDVVEKMQQLPSWGNARDMLTLAKQMASAALKKLPESGSAGMKPTLTTQEALDIMKMMLVERRGRLAQSVPNRFQRQASSPPVAPPPAPTFTPPSVSTSSSAAGPPPPPPPPPPPKSPSPPPQSKSPSPPPQQSPASPQTPNAASPPASTPSTPSAPSSSLPPRTPRARARHRAPKAAQPVNATAPSPHQPSPSPLPNFLQNQPASPVAQGRNQGVRRDRGVSDATWNALQAARRAEEEERRRAEAAIREAREALAKAQEEERKAIAAAKARALAMRQARDAARKAELKRQEEEAQRREAAAKAERERIARMMRAREEAERKKREEEARKQAKLRTMGVCPQGYVWTRQQGGYRCAGGYHFVTDSQLR